MSGPTRSRQSARPNSSLISPAPFRSPSSPTSSAFRATWGLSWSTGRIAWWRCTSSARTARWRIAPLRARAFTEFVGGYARARRGNLGDDLISQLLVAESDGGKLSEDELASTVILLLNAGHEATVNAIGNGVKVMLEHGLDSRSAFASKSAVAATVEEL